MSPRRRCSSPALALLALIAAGCSLPMYGDSDSGTGGMQPRRSGAEGNTAEAACRAEAERVLRFRDRGQIMREDDADARVGLSTATPTVRAETDRLGARFERDRIIQECMRGTGAAAPQNSAPPPGSPRPRS